MISRFGNLSELRLAIIAETKVFLTALKSGATDAQLIAIVRRIREKERQLLKQEGALLDPDMWRILHSRLVKRNIHFVDPNG
jgi:hypothetical protein